MIARDYITEWKAGAPWEDLIHVEQDLIISRLLVELFNNKELSDRIAFRGGTALYKLFINPPARYSEDIDLVQTNAEPIGETLGLIKKVINPILGTPKWKLNQGRATLFYKFQTEENTEIYSKIKIEINTREHFSVYGYQLKEFSMNSRWFSGQTKIRTYTFDELMGTKLRALYQRNKSRDLFDISLALKQKDFNPQNAINAFQNYLKWEDKIITRAMFEENIFEKMNNAFFVEDISPILSASIHWDIYLAAREVGENLIALLPGEGWKKNR